MRGDSESPSPEISPQLLSIEYHSGSIFTLPALWLCDPSPPHHHCYSSWVGMSMGVIFSIQPTSFKCYVIREFPSTGSTSVPPLMYPVYSDVYCHNNVIFHWKSKSILFFLNSNAVFAFWIPSLTPTFTASLLPTQLITMRKQLGENLTFNVDRCSLKHVVFYQMREDLRNYALWDA